MSPLIRTLGDQGVTAKENEGRERILLPHDNYCISNLLLVRAQAAFCGYFNIPVTFRCTFT